MNDPGVAELLSTGFVLLFPEGELAAPGKRLCEVGDRLVVVFHVDDSWYCLDDVCTHDGGPLGEGTLHGHLIACPRHGARFDIRDGHPVSMPATEPTKSHEVLVRNGEVYVRLAAG